MSGSANRTVQVNIVGDSSKLQGAMKKAGDSVESTGHRVTSAWKGVGSTIGTAFGDALEPVMGVLDKLGEGIDSLKEHASVGKVMIGVGAAASTAAAGLNIFGAKEKAADQQLGQAFQNIGANMDDYKDRIEGSVKSMAKFGYTGDNVKDALTQLVTATKDPKKALDLLQTAADLAATKHESLGTAVSQLTQIVAGKGTRTLQSLGITMSNTKTAAADLAKAQKAVESATSSANSAIDGYTSTITSIGAAHKATQAQIDAVNEAFGEYETTLDDNGHATKDTAAALADYQSKLKAMLGTTPISVTQNLALQKAQDKVTQTQSALFKASNNLTKAQNDQKTASKGQTDALTAVANATKGQAVAASDTWTGRLQAARAELENQVATIGQKYGPAIQGVSAAVTVAGGITDTFASLTRKAAQAEGEGAAAKQALAAATGEAAVADDGLAASEAAADAAGIPLYATIGLIVAAAAALGVGIYELVTHWSQSWAFMKRIVTDAWHGIDGDFIQPIEHFFDAIPGFITSKVSAIGSIIASPFAAAAGFISKHVNDIIWFIAMIPGAIGGFAGHMFDGIADAFKGMVNFIVGLWNDVANATQITLPSVHIPFVGDVGGGTIGPLLPTLPTFAEGGIVTAPMLAMVGDNRARREAIVPLEKAGQFGFGGGAQVAQVTTVVQVDGREIARTVRDHLLTGTARNARKVGLT